MQAPFSLDHHEHRPTLAEELLGVAVMAATAATYADGEYIPQMSRQHELRAAWRDAAHASAALQQIAVRVAHLDAAEDGLRLLKAAITRLDAGRGELLGDEDAQVDDELVAGGAAVLDSITIGAPGARFREAAELIRGLADLALLESLTPDEAFHGILGLRP